MQKRTLTGTQLNVSRIGLGLAALGRPGYITIGHALDLNQNYRLEAMETHAHSVLDAAYGAGVRYFDAARSYGRAEQFLRSWLLSREIAPDQIVVGSKWGYYYTADWQVKTRVHEVKEHSKERFLSQWQESANLLGDYLKLYQIHSATLESGVLENSEVLNALVNLKRKGVYLGLSVSGSRQAQVIELALKVKVDGQRVFDCVQATWNLLEKSAGAALQQAHAEGMGVIVKEALANGRLTHRNNAIDFQNSYQMLTTESTRLGCSMDALAMALVLQNPWVDIVLSGAAQASHLQSNLTALDLTVPQQTAASLATGVESPEKYWRYRSQLLWN